MTDGEEESKTERTLTVDEVRLYFARTSDLEATEKRLVERIAHVEGAREATRLLYVVMIPFVGSLVVALAIVGVNLYISFFVTPMD